MDRDKQLQKYIDLWALSQRPWKNFFLLAGKIHTGYCNQLPDGVLPADKGYAGKFLIKGDKTYPFPAPSLCHNGLCPCVYDYFRNADRGGEPDVWNGCGMD